MNIKAKIYEIKIILTLMTLVSWMLLNPTRRGLWNGHREGGLLKPNPVKSCLGTILKYEKVLKTTQNVPKTVDNHQE